MRSVTASLVAWSGRGPLLWAMGCPCRELTMRRRLAAPHRGGPDAGDRTAVPADRAASPAAVLHRALVCDPGRAGHRSPVGCRPTNRHRDVAGRGPGRECALVARAPLLRSRGVGPGPGRPGTGPRGRGPPGARRRRGHRGGGRHAVSPLRQEGARREVPPRRLGQGTRRHRPRQLLCDRRDRGGRALPGPPGLPAGPVPPAHPQDQRLQDRAGPRPGRPARRRAGRAHRPRGGDAPPARTGLARPAHPRHFTTRLAANAVLYGPQPPRTGKRGHPAWKGQRLGSAADMAATTTWTRTRVTRYGTTETVDLAVITCLWWGRLHRTPIRVVWVRDTGETKPYTLALATTDLTTPAGRSWPGTPPAGPSSSRSRTARTSSERATPKTGSPQPSSAPHPCAWPT